MSGSGIIDPAIALVEGATAGAARSVRRRFVDRYPALRALSMYSAAVYAGQGLSLLCSFSLASILGPASFGLWRFLKLILAYLVRVGEAGMEGLRRELPEAVGAGRHEQADEIIRTLISTHLLMGLGHAGLCTMADVVAPHWWPAAPG